MVLPGMRVIKVESLQPSASWSCARRCALARVRAPHSNEWISFSLMVPLYSWIFVHGNGEWRSGHPIRTFRTKLLTSRTILPSNGCIDTPVWSRLVYPMPCEMKIMQPHNQRDLFPGALEMMILQTLKRKPLHGYALAQHIKRTSKDLLQIEEGSLYPALQRLLKEELVKAEWCISSTNRRVRIYKLTARGAKHLEQEVSRFERMLEGITRVLAPGES